MFGWQESEGKCDLFSIFLCGKCSEELSFRVSVGKGVDEDQNKSDSREMRNVKIFRELRGACGVFSFDAWIIQKRLEWSLEISWPSEISLFFKLFVFGLTRVNPSDP